MKTGAIEEVDEPCRGEILSLGDLLSCVAQQFQDENRCERDGNG